MTLAIETVGLTRVFEQSGSGFAGRQKVMAVDDVSMRLRTGRALAIVGESGCGKSTLARVLLGLLPPSSGTVRIDGRELASIDRRERVRLIQPVFQDPMSSLNPRRRVADNIALPLIAAGGVGRAERDQRVAAMMAQVGLSSVMGDRYPAQLSGGQRQRVAIARALLARPRILICDEPTSALDVSVQAQILNLLADLRATFDLTLVFISHNLAVVEHVADEVAVMYLGRIVEHDDADKVFRQPKHPYTKALLASVLTPEPGLGLPDVALGDDYPDPAHIPSGCRFHTRCPVAMPICETTPPARRPVECHLVPN